MRYNGILFNLAYFSNKYVEKQYLLSDKQALLFYFKRQKFEICLFSIM